ncbi:MAG TPA: ThuA domain-containing protein, partial [Candidatus Hydrogenedentes bacterium]|nr:ThuA domain-containing protein [Candidatus Hydrogenedentota bacterium]
MKTAACLVLCLVAGGTVHLRAAEAAGLPVPTDAELAKIREAAPEKPTVAPRSPRRVLVFSLVPTGYVHSAIPYGEAALRIIAEKTGAFSVECSNNIAMFEPENLNRFDAVFFNNTNSALFLPGDFDTLSGAQKEAARKRDAELKQSLAAFIRNGKGIVALHAALAIFAEWEAWGDIIGGRFDNHPWNKEVTVRV